MQRLPAFNPASAMSGTFEAGIASKGGYLVVHNLSAQDLLLVFDNGQGGRVRESYALANASRNFKLSDALPGPVEWLVVGQIGVVPPNASNQVLIEAYLPSEADSATYSADHGRLTNVGNTVATTGATEVIINDGNPPGTPVIEMTPADQTSSAVIDYNDGGLIRRIISAGVLRNVLTFVRGDFGTTEASITIGDADDPGMTVLHGSADNAAQAGQAVSAVTANTARTVQVYDGALANLKSITQYEGVTDPSTYIIPSFGDIWWQG